MRKLNAESSKDMVNIWIVTEWQGMPYAAVARQGVRVRIPAYPLFPILTHGYTGQCHVRPQRGSPSTVNDTV